MSCTVLCDKRLRLTNCWPCSVAASCCFCLRLLYSGVPHASSRRPGCTRSLSKRQSVAASPGLDQPRKPFFPICFAPRIFLGHVHLFFSLSSFLLYPGSSFLDLFYILILHAPYLIHLRLPPNASRWLLLMSSAEVTMTPTTISTQTRPAPVSLHHSLILQTSDCLA
jgi:hypothetical protein